MNLDLVGTYVAAGSLLVISILTSMTRVGPALITMGTEDDEDLRAAVKRAMLGQNQVAFWMVIVSGGAAAVVLLVAVALLAYGRSPQLMPKVIQIICGLGNSALFRYFYKVWKESGEILFKMA